MMFNPSPSPVNAAEVIRFLGEHAQDRVAVEEQDHAAYLIHIGEVASWVAVRSESPVFAELRQRHAQWMTDHPGWNGWIAF